MAGRGMGFRSENVDVQKNNTLAYPLASPTLFFPLWASTETTMPLLQAGPRNQNFVPPQASHKNPWSWLKRDKLLNSWESFLPYLQEWDATRRDQEESEQMCLAGFVHLSLQWFIHTHAHVHIHAHIDTHACTLGHMYMHARIHTHTYMYALTHTWLSVLYWTQAWK